MVPRESATMQPTEFRTPSPLRKALPGIFVHLMLVGGGALVLLPFFWMISTSLKYDYDAFQIPPRWLPYDLRWQNYEAALFDYFNFGRALGNTLIITFFTLAGRLLFASLVAFGFARIPFVGRGALFILVLSTLMVPQQVTIIPRYILFREMEWLNTFLPLIIPAWTSAFFIFLLRQFIMTIPSELDDAARIDGAGWFRIYWQIIMPQIRPALAAVAIFSFLDTWNDFFEPLIFLRTPELHTLAVSLHYYSSAATAFTSPDTVVLMAGAVMVMIPPLLLFFFAQRIFIQGVVVSGIKG